MVALKERLSDRTWLADHARLCESCDASIADILQAADAWHEELAANGNNANHAIPGCLINRVEAQEERLCVQINVHALLEEEVSCQPTITSFEVPFQKRLNGRAKSIVIVPKDAPQTDPDLIGLVADARRWAGDHLAGKASTIQQITEREGLRSLIVGRILPSARLAPDITTAILEGRQPSHLSAKSLRNLPELPLDWDEQRQILGFPHPLTTRNGLKTSHTLAPLRLS